MNPTAFCQGYFLLQGGRWGEFLNLGRPNIGRHQDMQQLAHYFVGRYASVFFQGQELQLICLFPQHLA